MPLYQFECRKCGWTGERLSRYSERGMKTCPECEELLEVVQTAPNTIKINGVIATSSQNK